MNKVKEQFSIHSKEYEKHNIIQQIIAKALARDIDDKAQYILELGCGSGQIYKNISHLPKHYIAVDFSQAMCDLHPKDKNLDIYCFDFDSKEFYSFFENKSFDLILSSSAMQWSKDLAKLISFLLSITKELNLALFTSNTFKSIFDITKQSSPILTKEDILSCFSNSVDFTYEIYEYKLEFPNKKELFDYIKKSGVKGGMDKLSYKESKNLYLNYPYNYLEFEVIFIKAFSKS